MGGVPKDGGKIFDVGEPHCLAYASMVAQEERGNDRADDGEQSSGVNFAERNTLMGMAMMRLMTYAFEDVLEVMGYKVHTHEEEENRHGEASENFRSFETERMPYRRAFPDFEVAEDVDHDAQHSTQGVEEDKVGERGHGQ